MGLLSTLVGGLFNIGATERANASNEYINMMNQDYNDKLIASDREYNDPIAQASRLRAAGISPSLVGIDNVPASSSAVEAKSNADNIMAGAANLNGLIQNELQMSFDKDKLEFEKSRFEDDVRRFNVQQDNQQRDFELKQKYYDSLIRKSNLDSDKIEWDNKSSIAALAFELAVNDMAIPESFTDDQKSIIKSAMDNIDRNSWSFRTQRSIAEKNLSAAESERMWQKAQEDYAKQYADLDVRLTRQLQINEQQAALVGRHLDNEQKRLHNELSSQTLESTVAATNEENNTKISDSQYRKNQIKKTEELIQQLKDIRDDKSLRHRVRQFIHKDYTDSQLSMWIEELEQSLNSSYGVTPVYSPRGSQGTALMQGFQDAGSALGSPLQGILKR